MSSKLKSKPPVEQPRLVLGVVWRPIEGYEPMMDAFRGEENIGWIRPCNIGKSRPQPWGLISDWPGKWEAIPKNDWSLSTICDSYEAARNYVETFTENAKHIDRHE